MPKLSVADQPDILLVPSEIREGRCNRGLHGGRVLAELEQDLNASGLNEPAPVVFMLCQLGNDSGRFKARQLKVSGTAPPVLAHRTLRGWPIPAIAGFVPSDHSLPND